MLSWLNRTPDVVDVAKTKPLGRARAIEYIGINGHEFMLEGGKYKGKEEAGQLDGQVLVKYPILEDNGDGRMVENGNYYRRALPLPDGTVERERRRRRQAVPAPTPHSWDRLASSPLMQHQEPRRVVDGHRAIGEMVRMPADSKADLEAIEGAVELATRRPAILVEVGGHEAPERSVAGLIALAAQQGVTLSLERGELVADSAQPIRADLLELLDKAQRLIIAHLQGKTVMCSKCAAPAVTIVAVNAARCASHAE